MRTITNKQLSKQLSLLYNVWFIKWSRKIGQMSKEDWERCVDEFGQVVHQDGGYQTVKAIGCALLDELDAREKEAKNGRSNQSSQ